MISKKPNLIIDLSAVGSFKTGYYTYATFLLDSIYNSSLFSGKDVLVFLSKNSSLNEYVSNCVFADDHNGSIRFVFLPNATSLLRIFISTIYACIYTLFNLKTIVFSPINYGPLVCFGKHYLFIHDLSVWGLPSAIQHRSNLSLIAIRFCIRISTLFARKIICQSNSTLNILLKTFPSYAGKTTVMYLPLPSKIKQFLSPHYNLLSISTTMPTSHDILFVSSFYPLKNQMMIIQASKYMPEFVFHIVGNPIYVKYFNSCFEMAKDLPNVNILTNCDDDNLMSLYSKCAIYVQPSYFEGLSLTPLEALSFQCSLVLSDIDAHREFYEDYCCSFFKPYDVYSLVCALKRCFENKSKPLRKSAIAIDRKFDSSDHLSKLNAMFVS